MHTPEKLTDFDIQNAEVQVWVYKESYRNGNIHFKGRWIDTNDELDTALRQAITETRNGILEISKYSLLAAATDGIALHLDGLVTNADAIISESASPTPERKVKKIQELQNIKFYIVKLISGDNVLYAVKKADNSWKTKKTHSIISVFYSDDQLGVNKTPGFTLSKNVDFFIIDNDIVIINKNAFESVANYKEAHASDFQKLQGEEDFLNLFNTIGPIVEFVGANKLHLRRACAIRQKEHYKDPSFMQRLREKHAECGLNITFDDDGRIIPTPESCPDIIRALLDHRLSSFFSQKNYDVPDATAIQ